MSNHPFPAYIECCPYEPFLPEYTPEQQLEAVLAKDEVMNLMGLRNYYYVTGDLAGLLEDLWVREPENRATASFGTNYGFYIGWAEIQRALTETCLPLEAASQSVNTPLIYVAQDGKTARGLWYSDGYFCDENGDADILYGKVAVDFILEGTEWKIWHLVIGGDLIDPLHREPTGPDYGILGKTQQWFGTPTVACTTHDPRYNWNDNYPPEPGAYETFSLKESYAPEGCPRYRQHLREVNKHAKK
jgi:hypothetical protein